MELVVAPVLHSLLPDPIAVNVTLPPWQKVVAPDAVAVAVGKILTVILMVLDESVQFDELVTNTL